MVTRLSGHTGENAQAEGTVRSKDPVGGDSLVCKMAGALSERVTTGREGWKGLAGTRTWTSF